MSVSLFDPDRGNIAANTLDDTTAELTPGWVIVLTDRQTTGKWGGQPGAQAFMGAYVDALNQMRDTMEHLKGQTDDLAASTRGITRDATETDAQAAQQLQTHWHNHRPDHAPDPTAPGLDTKPVAQ